MKRRHSLKVFAASALSAGAIGKLLSQEGEFDTYGGWTGKKFEATGFFRAEKDERWWLVTPEGNAFLSFGINHLSPNHFRQPFNQEAWSKRLGVADLSDDAAFSPALRKWFLNTCKDYGFNTVGVHNALHVINRPAPAVPYLQPLKFVNIPHWSSDVPDENFVDVFSTEFVAHCKRIANEIIPPILDDPYLIGYSMTDCPLFTEEDCRERTDVIGGARRKSRIGWPRRLRNLGADAAGKQAYVKTMLELYQENIEAFNATYGTSFPSFLALAAAVDWRPHTDLSNANETRDNIAFLQATVARYYGCARDAIRHHDRHHLFVGDKLNANTDSMDTVLPITSQYTDIAFYQMYARYEVQEPGLNRWSQMVDMPVINGDSAFTMITETMPRPFGPVADSLSERAEWTEEFFRLAFARPEFVGWHYCGLINATNQIPRKKDRQHSGLLDAYGEPYAELQTVLKTCTDQLYQIGTGAL